MNDSEIKSFLDGFDEVWKRVSESKKNFPVLFPKSTQNTRGGAQKNPCQSRTCNKSRRERR